MSGESWPSAAFWVGLVILLVLFVMLMGPVLAIATGNDYWWLTLILLVFFLS